MEGLTEYSHNLMRRYAGEDSVVIDATCGNGRDTLFPAGIAGKVYAFDIQEEAAANTRRATREYDNVEVIRGSHEYMSRYVEGAKGIIFNLGYLPGGEGPEGNCNNINSS